MITDFGDMVGQPFILCLDAGRSGVSGSLGSFSGVHSLREPDIDRKSGDGEVVTDIFDLCKFL